MIQFSADICWAGMGQDTISHPQLVVLLSRFGSGLYMLSSASGGQVGVLVPGALGAFRLLLEELYLPLVQGLSAPAPPDGHLLLQVPASGSLNNAGTG